MAMSSILDLIAANGGQLSLEISDLRVRRFGGGRRPLIFLRPFLLGRLCRGLLLIS
jgi:hypothetical protein